MRSASEALAKSTLSLCSLDTVTFRINVVHYDTIETDDIMTAFSAVIKSCNGLRS